MYRMTAIRRGMAAVALGLACALPAAPALAADRPLDWTFDGAMPRNRGGEKLYYRIGEQSGLQIVAREAGAPPNEHPAQLDPAIVKQQLLLVTLEDSQGKVEPLFGEQEAADISVELVKALATATAAQDVLLFSSSRRDQPVLVPPVGLSARFFVEKGRLNVLVAQPRVDYFGQWRINPSIKPALVFGSRTAPAKTPLRAPAGLLVRNDWAALPLVASVTAPVTATPSARPAVAPAVAPAAVPAPAPVAPAAGPSADPEQRLRTLKRLRDNNLISEEEFQQKKNEILKTL